MGVSLMDTRVASHDSTLRWPYIASSLRRADRYFVTTLLHTACLDTEVVVFTAGPDTDTSSEA